MDIPSRAAPEQVASPCVNICTLDAESVCIGCGRHIDEIAVWGAASPLLKRRIAAAARERLARLQSRPGQNPQVRNT
jgi:predicted Fe-S protein YdhL (DUF1289 family)